MEKESTESKPESSSNSAYEMDSQHPVKNESNSSAEESKNNDQLQVLKKETAVTSSAVKENITDVLEEAQLNEIKILENNEVHEKDNEVVLEKRDSAIANIDTSTSKQMITKQSEDIKERQAGCSIQDCKDEGSNAENIDDQTNKNDKNDEPGKEDKKLCLEYIEIVLDIKRQNFILNDLKSRVVELIDKPLLSRSMRSEIRGLRCLIEVEKLKLNSLIKKAVQFSQTHSNADIQDIPLLITLTDDSICSDCYRPGTHSSDRENDGLGNSRSNK